MDLLVTAKIRGSFGVDGFMKIESLSGEYEHFLQFKKVFLRFPESKLNTVKKADDWYDVETLEIRPHDILLKLKGIDSPESAAVFSGAELLVSRDMACPLHKGEYYITDLCESDLVYEGVSVGHITSVVEGGGGFLLEISEAATGRRIYIPFNAEFIGMVDIKKRTVELMHRWILE